MKLIKQNDSAGGLIFKQNNNGKAMKQNYNFRKGYVGGLTSQIQLPSEITLDNKSIMFWHKNKQAIPNECKFFAEDNSQSLRYGALNTYYSMYITFSGSTSLGNLFENEIFHAVFVIDPNGSYRVVNSVVRDITYTQKSVKYINITLQKFSDFFFFNRKISNSEVQYNYNSKLGNAPLSLNECLIWLKYDVAEIFDFGGTIGQDVGIRDYSGNDNHARILNLPVGTLQEQLDYANANLFEPW